MVLISSRLVSSCLVSSLSISRTRPSPSSSVCKSFTAQQSIAAILDSVQDSRSTPVVERFRGPLQARRVDVPIPKRNLHLVHALAVADLVSGIDAPVVVGNSLLDGLPHLVVVLVVLLVEGKGRNRLSGGLGSAGGGSAGGVVGRHCCWGLWSFVEVWRRVLKFCGVWSVVACLMLWMLCFALL